jgi:hypothetical protein
LKHLEMIFVMTAASGRSLFWLLCMLRPAILPCHVHQPCPPRRLNDVPQTTARREAFATVNKTLSQAAKLHQHLDAKVDAAADKAAQLAAKAAVSKSIPALRKAALAQVDVERVIRHVNSETTQISKKVEDNIKVCSLTGLLGRLWAQRSADGCYCVGCCVPALKSRAQEPGWLQTRAKWDGQQV